MTMDVKTIRQEIRQLEKAETNWSNIERLAFLYNVYDHLTQSNIVPVVAKSVEKVMPKSGEGEFCETCDGIPIDHLMSVLSEHMAVIKVLHPKEYEAVLEKIRGIP